MSIDSPVSVLYSTDGYQVAVAPGAAIAAQPRSIPIAGTDGSNSRTVLTTATGAVRIDPIGTTAQPITDNGGSLTVDGYVVVSQSSANNLNATVIGSSSDNSTNSINKLPVLSAKANTAAPVWTDGYQVPLSVDTSGALRVAGSITVVQSTAANLRTQTASEASTGTSVGTVAALIGGSVSTGVPTYTNGQMDPLSLTPSGLLRIDGSNVVQPVSGTITANIGTTNGLLLDNTFTTRINTLGQKAMASSTPVVISSDQSAVPVSGSITANIGTSGSLALDATLTGGTQRSKITDGTNNAAVKAASTAAIATDPALVVAVSPNNTVGVSGTITSNIGTTGGLALDTTLTNNSQRTKLTDGYNLATVKASNTTPTAADTALVVAISPSNTVNIQVADNFSSDAFGRFRTSSPYTIFDSKQLIDKQPLFWDDQQVSGASTASTYVANNSATRLDVVGNVAGRRIRQTFRRFNYQPGKGFLILFTGVLVKEGGAGITGVNRKIGYFDDNNGLFFQYGSTTMNVGIRTFTSGSAITTLIPQSNWNIDKLDGYGASGFTLDATKAQIFVIDFEWLGTGRIRYGFNLNGRTVYCHQINNANNISTVYMTSPNLPLRYEIESLGTGTATTCSLLHICTSVISEGGKQDTGYSLSVDRGTTALTTTNDTNNYGLLAIQLQAGASISSTIKQIYASVMSPTPTTSYRVSLVLNPTIAGTAPTYTPVANSSVQAANLIAANLISGGTLIFSTYDQSNNTSTKVLELPNDLTIGSNIAGTSDTLVLAVQPTPAGGAIAFYASLSWREEI